MMRQGDVIMSREATPRGYDGELVVALQIMTRAGSRGDSTPVRKLLIRLRV